MKKRVLVFRFCLFVAIAPSPLHGREEIFQVWGSYTYCSTTVPVGSPQASSEPRSVPLGSDGANCGGDKVASVSWQGDADRSGRVMASNGFYGGTEYPARVTVSGGAIHNGAAASVTMHAVYQAKIRLRPDRTDVRDAPPGEVFIKSNYSLSLLRGVAGSFASVVIDISGVSRPFHDSRILTTAGTRRGTMESTAITWERCPCTFTLHIGAHVEVHSTALIGDSAGAQDPFTIDLPAGWTYSIDDEPPATTGLRFVPLPPCRVMETRLPYNYEGRSGAFGPPSINTGETRTLNLPASNVCSIPSTAKAYVVNVTLIPTTNVDFVTLWPGGETRPNVWTIRSTDGQVVANSAIIKAGTNGGISVYSSDRTDLLIDISGYYTDASTANGLAYYPLTPCRVIESRSAYRSPAGAFGPPSMNARQTRKFTFPSTPYCTVPRAAAYSVTITAVPPGPLAYLTAWPDGSAQPNVSSINSFAGRVLANSIVIPAASDGSIDVFASDATDLIVDINGYFAADDGQNGLFYYPVTQCRASDSNVSLGPYPDDTARTIPIPSASGCSGIPATARAYAINVTALPNGNPMPFLTAWPTGAARPNASILNAFQGQVVTNSAVVPAGVNGAIDIYAFRRTGVVVEVNGYFGR